MKFIKNWFKFQNLGIIFKKLGNLKFFIHFPWKSKNSEISWQLSKILWNFTNFGGFSQILYFLAKKGNLVNFFYIFPHFSPKSWKFLKFHEICEKISWNFENSRKISWNLGNFVKFEIFYTFPQKIWKFSNFMNFFKNFVKFYQCRENFHKFLIFCKELRISLKFFDIFIYFPLIFLNSGKKILKFWKFHQIWKNWHIFKKKLKISQISWKFSKIWWNFRNFRENFQFLNFFSKKLKFSEISKSFKFPHISCKNWVVAANFQLVSKLLLSPPNPKPNL
jgi:hypothetical protein